MLSAIPWITYSTTVQKYSNHCNSIKYYNADPVIKSQTLQISQQNNKVAMSLHLHHVPQADMLECRLEILQIVPHPNNLHI
jgi:hypothetical protein